MFTYRLHHAVLLLQCAHIREMQIKGTVRCHYVPARMASIKITIISEDMEKHIFLVFVLYHKMFYSFIGFV